MSRDAHSRRSEGSSDRRLPSIHEELGDILAKPVGSRRREYLPPINPSHYHHSSSGHHSYTTQRGGGFAPSEQQQHHHSYQAQRPSDRYQQQQQQSREPRDGMRSDARETHSYHVHSLTEGGLVHKSTSNDDSFRLRPRKAESGDPSRRHLCDECDASFERPSALSTHKLSHSGAKPFRCSHPGCEKAFTSMSNKTRHEKTHYATSAFEDANQYSSRRQEGSSAGYYRHSSRSR